MAIEIRWYDSEETIVFGKYRGEWSWEEFSESGKQVLEMTENLAYRFDQIMDVSESGALPHGPALTYINRNSHFARNDNLGLTIFVGASPIIRGLISALALTNPRRKPRLFVDSVEEAYQLIKMDREKTDSAASND